MPDTGNNNIRRPLLPRLLHQTTFNISIKDYSHILVPDQFPLNSFIKCRSDMNLMKENSLARYLPYTIKNGCGIIYTSDAIVVELAAPVALVR